MIWTSQEEQIISEAYANYPPDLKDLSAKINRSIPSIKGKAREMRLVKDQRLSQEEVDLIIQHKDKSICAISEITGFTWNTVKKYFKKLNIDRDSGLSGFKWNPTEQEIEYLRSHESSPVKHLASYFKKSDPTIRKKMRDLGLMEPEAIRIKKVKTVKIVKVPRVINDTSGIDRIRLAMERINKI